MPLIRYRLMPSLIRYVYSDRPADKCDRFVFPKLVATNKSAEVEYAYGSDCFCYLYINSPILSYSCVYHIAYCYLNFKRIKCL